MFSTKGVSESGGKYISYGIRNTKIVSIEAKESDGNTSGSITIGFEETGTGKTASERFTFTDKSTQYSLRKIKHMLTKFITEEQADAIHAPSLTAYAAAISTVLLNKDVRIKFSGEEVAGKDGKRNWYKARINFPPFAEATTTNPTQLVFDNNTDVKRLSPVTAAPGAAATSDLPF